MTIQSKVFILKKIKYAESDLILNCLNSYGARINFIAKGALRSRKRFGGGVLDPLNYVQTSYQEKKNSDSLVLLKEATLIEDFPGLRSSYDRLETGFHFLKLILKLSREGVMDGNEVFHLLGNALRSAETSRNLHLLRTQFEMK